MLEFFTDMLTRTYYGNSVKDWLISLSIILGTYIVSKFAYWIAGGILRKLTEKTKTKLDDILLDRMQSPIIFGITLFGFFIGIKRLNFEDTVGVMVNNIFQVAFVITAAWAVTRLVDSFFKEYLAPKAKESETDLDDHMLPIIRKTTKTLIWTLALIIALNNAGYDVTALLAGLGIGGIAIAMAAKDTIENLFGGFTIFTDKPFKTNDRININGIDGFVREIGIRSTRIETLEGRIITVPNGKFSNSPIENISLEPSRKIVMNIGLTYSTSPAKMEKAKELLADIIAKNTLTEEKTLISFTEFADSSMNILFIYYVTKGKDILQAKDEVNMEILKRFNKAKLDFAYPSMTIYKG